MVRPMTPDDSEAEMTRGRWALIFFILIGAFYVLQLFDRSTPWKVNLYTNSAILNFNDTLHYNVILRYLFNISKALYYMPLLGKILQI